MNRPSRKVRHLLIGTLASLLLPALSPSAKAIPVAREFESHPVQKPAPAPIAEAIQPGAERMDRYLPLLNNKTVAVFANQTSVVGPANTHLVDTLLKRGIHISKIFSPEHGFRGQEDDGAKVSSAADPATGIPIVSLYGGKNKPSATDLQDVDILLFDIQDVGCRFYTYISSLQKYIEAAIENDKPLIILDRPNPNGFLIDGPILDPKFKSFVGMQPIPVAYGMTIGEYAGMLVGQHWLDPAIEAKPRPAHFKLTVIQCGGYTHQSKYQLPVGPSPNLPNMQSVYLYPSICFFEGTAVSLGRGTPKPFQQFGSPWFPKDLYQFTPVSSHGSHKPPLMDRLCYGYDLSNIDVLQQTGGKISLKWLLQAYQLTPNKDSFFLATNYIDKLAGSDQLQKQIRQGLTESQIRQTWQPGLRNFRQIRKKYLLYAD